MDPAQAIPQARSSASDRSGSFVPETYAVPFQPNEFESVQSSQCQQGNIHGNASAWPNTSYPDPYHPAQRVHINQNDYDATASPIPCSKGRSDCFYIPDSIVHCNSLPDSTSAPYRCVSMLECNSCGILTWTPETMAMHVNHYCPRLLHQNRAQQMNQAPPQFLDPFWDQPIQQQVFGRSYSSPGMGLSTQQFPGDCGGFPPIAPQYIVPSMPEERNWTAQQQQSTRDQQLSDWRLQRSVSDGEGAHLFDLEVSPKAMRHLRAGSERRSRHALDPTTEEFWPGRQYSVSDLYVEEQR